jgi:hypothetical protein
MNKRRQSVTLLSLRFRVPVRIQIRIPIRIHLRMHKRITLASGFGRCPQYKDRVGVGHVIR